MFEQAQGIVLIAAEHADKNVGLVGLREQGFGVFREKGPELQSRWPSASKAGRHRSLTGCRCPRPAPWRSLTASAIAVVWLSPRMKTLRLCTRRSSLFRPFHHTTNSLRPNPYRYSLIDPKV